LSDDYIFYKKYLINFKTGKILKLNKNAVDFLNRLICKKPILLISTYYRMIKEFERSKIITNMPKSFNYPLRVYLELTNRCNLNCKFCFNRNKNRYFELNSKDWDFIISNIPEGSEVTLFGGEPFLYEDIESVLNSLTSKKFNIRCFTNGVLTDKIVNVVKKITSPITIFISIDGIKSCNIIRGESVLNSVISTITKIKQNTNHKIVVKCVKTDYLTVDEIGQFLFLLDSLGVDEIKFGDLCEEGNAKINKLTPLNLDKDFVMFNYIQKIMPQLKTLKVVQDFDEYQPNYCGVGYRIIYFRCDGLISGCTELTDLISGSVFESDIKNLKSNIPQIFHSGELVNNSKCNSCGLVNMCCGGCRARAYRLTKDFNECDIYRKNKITYFIDKITNTICFNE